MGKVATLPNTALHLRKQHDYSWCIQWFKTFSELAGDTISAQRMMILLTVAEYDPHGVDQGKLADELGMDKSALSRSLNALTKYVPPSTRSSASPLVVCVIDPENRRKRVVSLTRRGKALIFKLYGDGTAHPTD